MYTHTHFYIYTYIHMNIFVHMNVGSEHVYEDAKSFSQVIGLYI